MIKAAFSNGLSINFSNSIVSHVRGGREQGCAHHDRSFPDQFSARIAWGGPPVNPPDIT
jgi:hypothetical protein